MVSKRKISYAKEKINKHAQPCGHNFEAIVHFKEYCDKQEKFYIYKVNDRRGNPDVASFVFKTSVEKLQIALNMNRDENTPLNSEFCFFDGKHNRCRGFYYIDSEHVPLSTPQTSYSCYHGSRGGDNR